MYNCFPWYSFQPGLMFAGKAMSLPWTEYLSVFTLTCKYWTRLESPARDRQPSLIETFVTYGCKKFYDVNPSLHQLLVANFIKLFGIVRLRL